KGLYAEQITRWKEGAATGNDSTERLTKAERTMWQKEKKKTRQLEKELRRKEKALAEAAALLILEKKVQAIWGGRGEE
ncbi:MAG: IS3 family transposase, partial [Sedimenticola sp.]